MRATAGGQVRLPGGGGLMRLVYVTYLAVIIVGLVFFLVTGLRHA